MQVQWKKEARKVKEGPCKGGSVASVLSVYPSFHPPSLLFLLLSMMGSGCTSYYHFGSWWKYD